MMETVNVSGTMYAARALGGVHAARDGVTLCGAVVEKQLPQEGTALTMWAIVHTFSGGCRACGATLETDPRVAQYATR